MIVLKIILVTLLVAVMFLYEFPRMKSGKMKEKAVFTVVASAGWGLALLLMFVPGLPGPTELINYVFRPIWSMFKFVE
ncbi:hypothetical protein ACM1RC_12040 [Paenibacillus azoreducens]|uniref:hypothetical protein n=1 Tax=Paenibacillus azoreducens TaxID=116718 RepID=UPI0039F58278